MLFYMISIAVVLIDQISKICVRIFMELGETVPFHRLLEFTYIENSGMARGLFPGYARLFAVIAILFVAGIMYYRKKGELRGKWMDIGTGFLAGGAIGNGIDRVIFGSVTDFLAFGSGRGIMNLADMAINIGVLCMVFAMVRAYVMERSEHKQQA
ncbi:signal peptidase II [Paenibacillus sp. S3N08]|uniref:Lipoprotein signal peptidase n=2 Tax=Paenibacillus agricola TaxID=2716264 RepID=A0ABX0J8M7_9BACL|nr:signal peptidase II [Paenibacillus agricola]